jgi:NAD(P)-dependent dehydrogenase (short-subunit alcohol dehydrogenase family)
MTAGPLAERVAVVTGALGRLGPVWCEALLDAGAAVAGVDLEDAAISPAFRSLQQRAPDRLRLYRADVCNRESLDAARARCEADLGPATILVNNAGIDQPPGPTRTYRIEEIPDEVVRGILDVNVVGAFHAIQVFGPTMVRLGQGSIINIGSLYASVSPDARAYDHLPCEPPFLKPPAYGASKAALVNLTRYLSTHWGPFGVRVNALSPGGVEGSQDDAFKRKFVSRVPLARMAVARDLGGPLIFLASDASSYVTGIELLVDGGYTAW